eukprot:354588-Chlamydomonas_euryale.AAC.5
MSKAALVAGRRTGWALLGRRRTRWRARVGHVASHSKVLNQNAYPPRLPPWLKGSATNTILNPLHVAALALWIAIQLSKELTSRGGPSCSATHSHSQLAMSASETVS